MTLIIAHRGASRAEPENTLAAFRRAARDGADGVELDVRRTADDCLVVHHDAALGDGRVVRATPSTDLPVSVPGLSAALDACDGMFVNIEIKNDPDEPDFDPTEWIAHRVAAELASRGTGRRWLISSFRSETLAAYHRLVPGVATAWLIDRPTDTAIERAAVEGHVAIHPQAELVTFDSVRAAHATGLAVNTWTCDDPERMSELMSWGIDGICTNVPDVAVAVRAGRSG